jgi:hypothetical protein
VRHVGLIPQAPRTLINDSCADGDHSKIPQMDSGI